MKIRLFAISLLIGAGVSYAADPQIGTGVTDGYYLVWQDLFDADQLNPLRWDIEVNGNGGGNNELQYYTDRESNVRLGDDGRGNHCLILTARRENYMGKNFTSGRLNTKNRIAFTHGKIEASIMMPSTADGLWPAFWMMGNDYDQVGWPRCGETDIVEMGNSEGIKNGFQDRFFNGACHWGPAWPNASYAKSTTKNYSLQDGEYHLFTLIWDENSIKMYVDRDKYPNFNPYYSIDIPVDDPSNQWSAGNYFHKDNFILFDLAVGGNFTGIHQAADITALNDENGQQASMYINYVRIYQKGGPGEHTDFLDPGDPDTPSGPADDPNTDNPGESDGIDAASISNSQVSFDGNNIYAPEGGISVINTVGREVASTSSCVLAVAGLAPGIYFVRSGSTTKKIIVK